GNRREESDAEPAPRGPGHAPAAMDRSRELQPRLSDARDAAAAAARRQARMAAHPGLLGREGRISGDRPRRRRVRLRMSPGGYGHHGAARFRPQASATISNDRLRLAWSKMLPVTINSSAPVRLMNSSRPRRTVSGPPTTAAP